MKQLEEMIVDEIEKENVVETDTKKISKIAQRTMIDHIRVRGSTKNKSKVTDQEEKMKEAVDSELPEIVLEDIRARLRNRRLASKFQIHSKSISSTKGLLPLMVKNKPPHNPNIK